MFNRANKQFAYTENPTFKKVIAPKISAHISSPICVKITGEDKALNAWLIDNLRTISPLNITLSAANMSSQRPEKQRGARSE